MWTIIARDADGKEVARADLSDKPLTIGRGKESSLALPSGSVSRKHARIELRNGKPFIFDEGSANGSLVDGRRVVSPIELNNNSAIEITPFRISVQGPPEVEEEEKTVMIKRPLPPPRPAAAPPPPPPPPPPRPAPPRPAAPPPLITSRPPPPPAWTPPPPPAARPAPPPPPESPRFIVSAAPPAPSAPPTATGPLKGEEDWDSAAAELERQMQSVRSYREQASGTTQSRVMQMEQDWLKLVANMQTLKARLAGNPRLLVFTFGRDNRDITVKIEDKRQRIGYRYFLMSRHHPDGKYPGADSVWLRETGREDMDFRDTKLAQSELLQRVAATLA